MFNFDNRVSLGNVLTILGGIAVAAGWFASVESADAKRDEKFNSLERRVELTETMAKDIQKIKVDVGRVQQTQNIMLGLMRDRDR